MLINLDPGSHWLVGQLFGIHLFAVLGGFLIGAAAVLLYFTIGRIAGVSGILFAGLNQGGPGPALAGLALSNKEVLVFLVAMLTGGLLQERWHRRRISHAKKNRPSITSID